MGKAVKILKIKSQFVKPLIDSLQPKTKIPYETRTLPKDKYDFKLIENQITEEPDGKVKLPLYLHIVTAQKQPLGHKFILRVEEPYYLEEPENEKLLVLKPTFKAELFLYLTDDLDGYLAIDTPKNKLNRLVNAIGQILGASEWFVEITFDLTNNEETLRTIFGNFVLFYTTGIPHELVKQAQIRGSHLEESPEYKRYVKDLHGLITAIMIEYPLTNGKTIKLMISASGRLSSPNKEFKTDERYQIVHDVLVQLKEHNIIGT